MKEKDFLFFIQSVCEFLKVNNDLGFCIKSSIHCVKKTFRCDVENIISKLNKGVVFSNALEDSAIFPEYAIKILRAGENSKNFKETFGMLKNFIEWNIEQKSKLKSALAYPIFTFLVFIGVTFLFSNYIAPSIFELLNSLNDESVKSFKFFYIFMACLKTLIIFSLICLFSLWITFYAKRDLFEKILLSIPFFGNFFKYKAIYMTLYYISTSLKQDVSILNSFDIAIKSSSGITKHVLEKIRYDITKGIKIHKSIAGFSFIPDIVSQVIKTGEDAGGLNHAFMLLEQIFYSKYQVLMKQFIHVLPVAMILVASVMMMCFVLLVFMPLYTLGI